jgi:uncharacterized protein YceK
MKYILLTILLFLCGCASTPYYPAQTYVGEYASNIRDYKATNNKEYLVEANKNWNRYLKSRIQESD